MKSSIHLTKEHPAFKKTINSISPSSSGFQTAICVPDCFCCILFQCKLPSKVHRLFTLSHFPYSVLQDILLKDNYLFLWHEQMYNSSDSVRTSLYKTCHIRLFYWSFVRFCSRHKHLKTPALHSIASLILIVASAVPHNFTHSAASAILFSLYSENPIA
jgi:hypothetical protein